MDLLMLRHSKVLLLGLLLSCSCSSNGKNNSPNSITQKSSNRDSIKVAPTDNKIFQPNHDKSIDTGILEFSKKNQDSLTAHGIVQLKNSNIKKSLTTKGTLELSNSRIFFLEHHGSIVSNNVQLNSAVIHGVANLNNMKIANNLQITGALKIQNSIMSSMSLISDDMYFSNVIVHNITINTINTNKYDQPKLQVHGNTAISGLIEFTGTPGVIEVFGPNVSINQYKNAAIVYK